MDKFLFKEPSFSFSDRDLYNMLLNEIIKLNASVNTLIEITITEKAKVSGEPVEKFAKEIADSITKRFNETMAAYAGMFGDKT